jgi:hypothetical protein
MKLFKRNKDNPNCAWSVRFSVRNKIYPFSTQTTDKALALIRAKDYRNKIVGQQFGMADQMKTRGGAPTFAELYKAYDALPAPKPLTRKRNISSLKSVLAVSGIKDSDRMDRLAAGVVLKYQQHCVKLRPDSNSAVVSCNSKIRQARSIVSRDSVSAYVDSGMNIPKEAVASFMERTLLDEAHGRPVLPSADAMAKVNDLLKDHPEHHRAFLLAFYGGLRAGEIREARRDWLDGSILHIGGDPNQSTTKGRKWRPVALPDPVPQLLLASNDPVYLVGPRRHQIVSVELNQMLKTIGFPMKPLQSCRRLAGSLVYTAQGPRQARDMLGHGQQATTDRFYARSLDLPKPIQFVG